jgi:hypothetical protein
VKPAPKPKAEVTVPEEPAMAEVNDEFADEGEFAEEGEATADSDEMEVLRILSEASSPSKGYQAAMKHISSLDAPREAKKKLIDYLNEEAGGDVDFALDEAQIPEGPVGDFLRALFKAYPALKRGLTILEGDIENANGSYDSARRVATLMSSTDPVSALHEIFHHAERMLDPATRKALIAEWRKAYDATISGARTRGNTKRAAALEFLKAAVDDRSIGQAWVREEIQGYFKNGVLRQGDYALASPSEFFAANAARIAAGKIGSKSLGAKIKEFFRQLAELAKGTLGLKSDAPVLRALRKLASGNGQFLSPDMLRQVAKRMEQGLQDYPLERKTKDDFTDLTVKNKPWSGKEIERDGMLVKAGEYVDALVRRRNNLEALAGCLK